MPQPAERQIWEHDAADLHDGFKAGRFTPVDVTDALLGRMDACEPALNAMSEIYHDDARNAARDSQDRWHKGQQIGPLDGVPVTVKDGLLLKGARVRMGTAALADTAPATLDEPCIERLRNSGAIIIGQTTMPDFGMMGTGASTATGTTRNPWNTDYNTCGSSSGAGAATAAGYTPISVGTDLCGSVRLPAAFTGLVGLKASYGRIPLRTPLPGRHCGPMTRSVRDARTALNVLGGYSRFDIFSHEAEDSVATPDFGLQEKKIGVMFDTGYGLPPDPEIVEAIRAQIDLLSEAGAEIIDAPIIDDGTGMRAWDLFLNTRLKARVEQLPKAARDRIHPFIQALLKNGTTSKASELAQAESGVYAFRERIISRLERFDFVISPTLPVTPWAAELPAPEECHGDQILYLRYTIPFAISGQPAISVNAGMTKSGLPIGMQIVGHNRHDADILDLAEWLEGKNGRLPNPPTSRVF